MPRGYCTSCNAEVTVKDGQCLLGHSSPAIAITEAIPKDQPGRHRAGRSRPQRTRPDRSEPVVVGSGGMRLIDMFGFREDTLVAPTFERPDITTSTNHLGTSHPVVTPARPARKVAPSVFDALPKLSELRQEDTENTGNLIQLLWEATDSYEPEQTWTPKSRDLQALKTQDRRWAPQAAVAVSLVLIVAAAAFLRPETDLPAIEQAAASSEVAVAQSEEVLASVRATAELLADANATGAQLSGAAIALTDLDTVSRDLVLVSDDYTRASEPELASLASEAGARGIAVSDRLSLSLSYRLIFNRVLVLPELPLEADTVSISDIGFSLASSISDSRSAIDDLPMDPSLDGQTRSATTAVDMVETLTVDYLQALRDGDRLAARVIANEIRATSGALHEALPPLLSEINVSVQSELSAFESALETLEG